MRHRGGGAPPQTFASKSISLYFGVPCILYPGGSSKEHEYRSRDRLIFENEFLIKLHSTANASTVNIFIIPVLSCLLKGSKTTLSKPSILPILSGFVKSF